MVIILDTPFSLGDLSPIAFPHVYVSRMIVDGPNQTVTVQYEMGVMSPENVWTPTPIPTQSVLNMQGAMLYPFFFTKPENLTDSLWNQVETLIYGELQLQVPRLAGTIGNPKSEQPTETTPIVVDPTSAPETAPVTEAVPDANV